jgi:homoserine kinase
MCVEHVCQFVSGLVALVSPVVESPAARQRQDLGVSFAEFTGARTVGLWLIEPHGLFLGVERERRGRGGGASGPRTVSLLHVADDNAAAARKRAMFTIARAWWKASRVGNDGWRVKVPASSANLGPGFDALAVAAGLFLEVGGVGEQPESETHPAVRAFRAAGGAGPLFVHSRIPGGRGLGFSGAARVGGLLAAAAQQGHAGRDARADEVLARAADLEGHADNVAASLFGGVVAVAGGRAVRVPLGCELVLVVWIPDRETATTAARRLLADDVPFSDAAFNVGRTALLVAGLAAGDTSVLRIATEDRLHQDRRLSRVPETRSAINAALEAGAAAAWLSGSGPTAAAFAEPGRADAVAAALPPGGRALVLPIDGEGAIVTAVSDQ